MSIDRTDASGHAKTARRATTAARRPPRVARSAISARAGDVAGERPIPARASHEEPQRRVMRAQCGRSRRVGSPSGAPGWAAPPAGASPARALVPKAHVVVRPAREALRARVALRRSRRIGTHAAARDRLQLQRDEAEDVVVPHLERSGDRETPAHGAARTLVRPAAEREAPALDLGIDG